MTVQTALVFAGAGLAAFVFFVLVFREQIGRFIDRTEAVSREGVTARRADRQDDESGPEEVEDDAAQEADELLKELDNELIVQTEDAFRERLHERIGDAEERERVLLRYLAAYVLAYAFLHVYQHIYGSQITLLRFLNQQGDAGAGEDVVRIFYDQATERNPSLYQNYSYDQWLQWVADRDLIDRDDELLRITVAGRSFLTFLVERGLSMERDG